MTVHTTHLRPVGLTTIAAGVLAIAAVIAVAAPIVPSLTAERSASSSLTAADDYGTRHFVARAASPTLTENDDFGTRARRVAPSLTLKDDYATRFAVEARPMRHGTLILAPADPKER